MSVSAKKRTFRSKKLLGAPGIATRSKNASIGVSSTKKSSRARSAGYAGCERHRTEVAVAVATERNILEQFQQFQLQMRQRVTLSFVEVQMAETQGVLRTYPELGQGNGSHRRGGSKKDGLDMARPTHQATSLRCPGPFGRGCRVRPRCRAEVQSGDLCGDSIELDGRGLCHLVPQRTGR